MTIEMKRRVAKGLQLGLVVGVLVGLSGLIQTAWLADPIPALAQTVTVDSTQSPLVVNAVADLADLTPTDGQSVIIKTGTEKGLWYYDKDSAIATGVSVLNGPGSVGRFLVINNDAGSVAAATAITAAEITDDSLLELQAFDGSSAKSLTIEELKKTGVQVYNVKQYGATGDGTTDDWSAIQAALDDAFGNTYTAGVKTVYLPPGRYSISRPLYITDVVYLTGAGWNQSLIDGSGIVDSFCVLVTGNYSRLSDFSVMNTDGSGVAWVLGGYKSSAENLWVGGTVKDIAFLNAGSQQLKWENLWVSSNGRRVSPGSTYPKVGFACTSFLKYGVAVADITNTGLNGLTLTFQFAGVAHTVTVSGNHIRDAVDAINAKTIDSGLVAAYTNDDELVISATGYDDATDAANCDNDIVLTNGTGLWSALGMTAATYATGDTIGATNGSQMMHCHAEGCTKYGVIIDSSRHSDSKRGFINVIGGVYQGNATTDVVIKDSRYVNMHGTYVEPSGSVVLALNQADYFSAQGCITSNVSLVDTHGATFVGTNVTKASIDTDSSQTSFIACNLSTSMTDKGLSTKYFNCTGTAYPDGSTSIGNNLSSSRVVNKNTLMTYPSPVGVDVPWGFVKEGPTTTARVTGVDGPYAYEVNHQTWADYGLSYTIPAADAGTTSSQVRQQLSVFARLKRTNALARTPTEVGVVVEFNDGSSTISRIYTSAGTVDAEYPINEWVEKTFAFDIVPGHGDIKVTLTSSVNGGSGLAQIIVDAFVISIGDVAASTSLGTTECKRLMVGATEITTAAAAPTSGEYMTGAIVFNSSVGSSGSAGWICTAGGTPGTWKEFAPIGSVEANTAGSGTPNALTSDESFKTLTNEGTTAANYHTLPTAVAGLTYTFAIPDTDGMRITAATGDTIRLGANVTATAGYVESTSQGGYLTVTSINATEWIGLAYGTWTNGTWTYEVLDTP